MATVLITGGTGLIGTALTKTLLVKGFEVIILTRDAGRKNRDHLSYATWDTGNGTVDGEAIKKADYVIHLAGANVADGRWTEKRKKEIIDSRVKSGELIAGSLKAIPNKVKAVISSSAIGYYGPDLQKPNPKLFVETDVAANDFLGTVVQQWERAIQPVGELNKRLVILRTGIVLSNKGGAYKEFKKPFKLRIAAILGSGKQMISWIHVDDLVHIYMAAIENENWAGVYNAVAPHPVSNAELVQTIGAIKYSPYICVHVPVFALKFFLGEMSIEVLKSTTVSAAKIEREGFLFVYPTIERATLQLEAS